MSDEVRAKVFLLAQNRLLREVLSRILLKKNDIQVVGSSPFCPESLQQISAAAPDVLIVDSPGNNLPLADLVRQVQASVQQVKLVLIGMDADGQHFLQAVREGAMGYLVKDASAVEVVAAVRTVANGGAVCSPDLCAFLFRVAARERPMPNFHVRSKLGLTNREQQLVGLISRGLTNKQIASELGIAEQTVRNHIHRMLKKLGASHRLAVVDMCRMEGAFV